MHSKRSFYRSFKLLSASIGMAMVAGIVLSYALFIVVRPDQDGIYQGLWHEVANKVSGGNFRVMVHCPLHGRRAGHFVRASDANEARAKLAWQLPVCDLIDVAEQEPDGIYGAWYRGNFTCPSNYYRKPILLSARDMDAALGLVRSYARGCRVEYADQVDCPLIDNGCRKASVDFRKIHQLSGSALR